MPDFYASGWFVPGGHRDNDGGRCDGETQISRHKKGRSGRRRHHCVNIDGNNLREDKGGAGGNPCAGFSSITKIGGAHEGHGDYTGKSDVFGGAAAGLKCGLNNDRITDATMRTWSGEDQMNRVIATGKRGDGGGQKKDRTLYEQLLFGFSSSAGTQRTGYCSNTANLMKVVSNKNETCYDKIKSAMNAGEAEREAREWCKTNRSSPKCKCVNVQDGGTNFINHCKSKFEVIEGKPKARFIWFGFDNRQDYLNIAQIEVFTGEKDSEGNMINMMRKKSEDGESYIPNPDISFTVSSEHSSGQYGTGNLNDGNYTSIFHSDGITAAWVQVDLGKLTTIDSVKVWNEKPCDPHGCEKRWRGAFIILKDLYGNEIGRTERIEGDHMEGGKRVKTFDTFVVRDQGWAGCPEIVSAFKAFEDAGLTSASGLFGNSDCLVPGLCDGSGVIMPSSGKPNACSNKLAICDQKVAADNIKAQNLLIEQGCEINFEANIDAPDGQTAPPPPPPPSSSSPSSTPLTSSSSSKDKDKDKDKEELEIYEKPGVQIGAVGSSSMVSIFSCLMLIMLTV